MKTIIYCLLFIGTQSSLSAAYITWTGAGGNKLWSNPANWDTGTVPGAGDDVYLPFGAGNVRFNYVFRRLSTLTIDEGAQLKILPNAHLKVDASGKVVGVRIEPGATLLIEGQLTATNAGTYSIDNAGYLTNHGLLRASGGLNSLYNSEVLLNEEDGVIELLHASSYNLEGQNGSIVNEGEIRFLNGGSGSGLRSFAPVFNLENARIIFELNSTGSLLISGSILYNYGQLEFLGAAGFDRAIFLTAGELFNESTGEILVDGNYINGISAFLSSRIENRGTLTISNDLFAFNGILLGSSSSLLNASIGQIEIFDVTNGIISYSTTAVDNYGSIELSSMFRAWSSYSTDIFQYTNGSIQISNANIGFVNQASAIFTNAGGTLTCTADCDTSIYNLGTFQNDVCSKVISEATIHNEDVFLNYGFLSTPVAGDNHSVLGPQILNFGVVHDPYERFGTTLSNQRILALPLGDMQVNVAYPNALEVLSMGDFSVGDWYTDATLTTSAGVYDNISNTFFPNSNALGQTSLFIEVMDDLNSCSDVFELPINGTVSPLSGAVENWLGEQELKNDAKQAKLNVFPNPSSGPITVYYEWEKAVAGQLRVLNTLGEVVHQQAFDQSTLQLSGQETFVPGTYYVQLWEEGQMLAQERLVKID